LKKLTMLTVVLLMSLTAAIPALAVAQLSGDTPVSSVEPDSGNPDLATPPGAELDQVVTTIVDCVVGGPCVGTNGNDAITGSQEEDGIIAFKGDDA
jgi:hypothetical protein